MMKNKRNSQAIRGSTPPSKEKANPVPTTWRPAPIAGVILCGGKGTRMGRTRSHKVCEPIAGRPAIVRLIDTLRIEGTDPLVVVVGHQSGEVIETIGAAHPGVLFVYQRDRLGTGHAARIGIEALSQLGYDGPVLITMGDKWFAPGLLADAQQRFHDERADLLLVTTPKRPDSGAGRLLNLPGRGIVGIVERRDIERSRILNDWLELASHKKMLTRSALRRIGLKRIQPASKLWRALGPLARFARGTGNVPASELAQVLQETGVSIQIDHKAFSPQQVEHRSSTVNESVYIGNIEVVRSALHRVGRANAQDEYYLTDIIEITGRANENAIVPGGGRIVEYCAQPERILAFNTRQELRRIEAHVAARQRALDDRTSAHRLQRQLRTPEHWLKLLSDNSPIGRKLIQKTYGAGGSLVRSRMRNLRGVVRLFSQHYDDHRNLFLIRAPGRINLMGRHIDHQGGHTHSMALDCEVVVAASPRNDDVIRLVNSDGVTFPKRELVLSDWRRALRALDWLSFVDGEAVRTHLMSTAGDWSNYVLAVALYQQFCHPERQLYGMDLAVSGNVPMAAGLSSSSALVVAAMEAFVAVNGIQASESDIVSACGQAEWFVGSRGGAADHAAIRLGKAGHVARMAFHPFRISRYVPIPSDATILIAYSGQHAVKSAGARDRFNERVACYRIGTLLLQRQYPSLAARIEYIRDLLPSRLGMKPSEVCRLLQCLPERITRAQIRRRLGKAFSDRLEHIFSAHADPGQYTIRDVVTFGIGECERSRIAAGQLERGDLTAFGELMLLSHDGDRVSGAYACPDGSLAPRGDKSFERLIGAYACSTTNIDRLVDLARNTPGVYGAQLAGAGLGGCVMVLAHRSAASRVRAAMTREYYEPLGISPAVWQVQPVSGGGIIQPAKK